MYKNLSTRSTQNQTITKTNDPSHRKTRAKTKTKNKKSSKLLT